MMWLTIIALSNLKEVKLLDTNDYKNKVLMQTALPQVPEEFFEQIIHFRELMLMYHSAIKEITTKLDILNDELSLGDRKNPIQFIKSRVKKPPSIVSKLQALEKEITVDSIVNSLNDVAGIRVICSFIDDVYKIADMLTKQDDIVLIRTKDYIKNPKPNGYRSYHLIVEVPVFFSDKKQLVKVEIQIRTVAMDFWAGFEHQLKYKKDLEHSKSIEAELKECADTIAETDLKMMDIRNRMEEF